MIIWVDDLRTAPVGTVWCKSTNEAIAAIMDNINTKEGIEYLDLDHDAGDYVKDGGDYINILKWLEYYEISIPIRLHTMNPVGRQNMLAIANKNNWEVLL